MRNGKWFHESVLVCEIQLASFLLFLLLQASCSLAWLGAVLCLGFGLCTQPVTLSRS